MTRWWLVSALALAALVGCRENEAETAFRVQMRVSPDPPVVGVVHVDVDLQSAAGMPMSGAAVTIEGNMTHPGMAPIVAEARQISSGTYRADLDLTMAGDWVLLVDARFPDGRAARRMLSLPAVRNR